MAEKPGSISANTKISLKDVAYIVCFALWLSNIQNKISQLSLKIDGKFDVYDLRISSIEKNTPGVTIPGHQMSATPAREVKQLADIESDD